MMLNAGDVAKTEEKYLVPKNPDQNWTRYWSYLDGDGDLTWGPDASLTQKGYVQAVDAHSVWATEMSAYLKLPTTVYCNPLTRCLVTSTITFAGFHRFFMNKWGSSPTIPVIKVVVENCREKCDQETAMKRRSRTYITQMFPNFIIEDGFTEDDQLWHPGKDTDNNVSGRANDVLDRIFNADNSGDFISITTDEAFINSFLITINERTCTMPLGGVLPIVVHAYIDS